VTKSFVIQFKKKNLCIDAFLAQCPRGCLLGLDLGQRSIGLALSNRERTHAFPWKLVHGDETWPRHIVQSLFKQRSESHPKDWITGLVIGWPLLLSGSEGSQCQSTLDRAIRLDQSLQDSQLSLPMLFWDERFSSVEAHSMNLQEASWINPEAEAKKEPCKSKPSRSQKKTWDNMDDTEASDLRRTSRKKTSWRNHSRSPLGSQPLLAFPSREDHHAAALILQSALRRLEERYPSFEMYL